VGVLDTHIFGANRLALSVFFKQRKDGAESNCQAYALPQETNVVFIVSSGEVKRNGLRWIIVLAVIPIRLSRHNPKQGLLP
jgi:hypothetical protein